MVPMDKQDAGQGVDRGPGMARKSLREQSLEQALQQMERDKARLERRLAGLEEKLSTTLDGTGLRLWQLEVPSGKLTIFNMEWGKMLGFQPHELEANVETWKSKLTDSLRQTKPTKHSDDDPPVFYP